MAGRFMRLVPTTTRGNGPCAKIFFSTRASVAQGPRVIFTTLGKPGHAQRKRSPRNQACRCSKIANPTLNRTTQREHKQPCTCGARGHLSSPAIPWRQKRNGHGREQAK